MIKICVDASITNGNPGTGEYRGVALDTKEVLFEYKFPCKVSNNIAEWAAIIHGIQYCEENFFEKAIVYSDSQTAISWVSRKAHKSNMAIHYPELYTKWLDDFLKESNRYLSESKVNVEVIFWNKKLFKREIPADYGRK